MIRNEAGNTGTYKTETDKAAQKSRNFRRGSIVLVSVLLALTFFSKSLYNYRLPVVTAVRPKEGKFVYIAEGTSRLTCARTDSTGGEETGEWLCSMIVSEEQAKHIDMASVPVVTVISRNEKLEGKIQSITAYDGREQAGYQVTVAVTAADRTLAGASVSIMVRQESMIYNTLIPVEALCRDAEGYYVLVLRENDSVLGEGFNARRMSVDLLDSDGIYCAVRGIPGDEYVIVSATGEIGDGSNVYYDGV